MEKRRLSRAGLVGVSLATAALVAMVWFAGDASRADATSATAAGLGKTRIVNGAEYPVNENGQTYGDIAPDSNGYTITAHGPDLIAVWMPDRETTGYAVREDMIWFESQGDCQNPEEAVAWMEAGQPMDPIPLYAEDGETQIGWWAGENGRCEARWL